MNSNRLKDARLKAQHTQESLGEILGTDPRQIWRWESGKTVPNGDDVARLATALGVSTDYLLGLSDEPITNINDANLNEQERSVLYALRRGEKLEAIRIIAAN